MTTRAKIKSEFSADIIDAEKRFRDHEGVNSDLILKWMSQFGDQHLYLAAKILKSIRYYNATKIREMTNHLCAELISRNASIPKKNIYFVSVSKPGDSSEVIFRILRGNKAVRGCKFVRMTELIKADPGDISLIVFVDDFSGTGKKIHDWWETIEPVVLPIGAKIIMAILVMCHLARTTLEKMETKYCFYDLLGESESVLAEANQTFTEAEKVIIRRYCEETRCSSEYLFGFGNLGLLLSFKFGCPNNCLPILWYNLKGWQNLFLRHAI